LFLLLFLFGFFGFPEDRRKDLLGVPEKVEVVVVVRSLGFSARLLFSRNGALEGQGPSLWRRSDIVVWDDGCHFDNHKLASSQS
jgi:hypothetical protein